MNFDRFKVKLEILCLFWTKITFPISITVFHSAYVTFKPHKVVELIITSSGH